MENRSCYGQAFRQLRLDRGYSLKEAAGNIISPQMLGVFEHGKSGISLNNFGRLLIRIGATWNDFFRYYNGESILKELSLSDEILVKINNGHYYDGFKLVESSFEGDYSDNPILETVYKLSYQSYFQTLSLTSKLTDDELEIVLNYLNRIDTWGIFEYSVLSYILADDRILLSFGYDIFPIKVTVFFYLVFLQAIQMSLVASKGCFKWLLKSSNKSFFIC